MLSRLSGYGERCSHLPPWCPRPEEKHKASRNSRKQGISTVVKACCGVQIDNIYYYIMMLLKIQQLKNNRTHIYYLLASTGQVQGHISARSSPESHRATIKVLSGAKFTCCWQTQFFIDWSNDGFHFFPGNNWHSPKL